MTPCRENPCLLQSERREYRTHDDPVAFAASADQIRHRIGSALVTRKDVIRLVALAPAVFPDVLVPLADGLTQRPPFRSIIVRVDAKLAHRPNYTMEVVTRPSVAGAE